VLLLVVVFSLAPRIEPQHDPQCDQQTCSIVRSPILMPNNW
jgi:hypothetical protein